MSTTRHPQASVLAGGDYTVARNIFGSLEDLQYDIEHLLQACPLHDTLRCQFWPVETAVTRKLYGSLEDMQYDSRTSAAGMSTTRHPQAPVLAGGDYTVARNLFGSLEDLQRTAAFEQGTGVSIGVFDKKTRASPGYMLSSVCTRSLSVPLHQVNSLLRLLLLKQELPNSR